ncbi:HIT domain-containing protein [Aidingimonas lacisalsi]|uniref:HIT domain-containing protein n=1 Tax=Aidingimonas lacisalsi TaxID=2604086 RepID=UPI0011D2815F|nr:HIT family protein [Aidingimonas lacisalsi]
MSTIEYDARLLRDSIEITDLSLCHVRLMNDVRFPWLVLIPRRADVQEVYELDEQDQAQLWREATTLGQAMMISLGGDKLNLASLGNMVAQLHVHAIVRRRGDQAWPGPVWGHGDPTPYDETELTRMHERLLTLLDTSSI